MPRDSTAGSRKRILGNASWKGKNNPVWHLLRGLRWFACRFFMFTWIGANASAFSTRLSMHWVGLQAHESRQKMTKGSCRHLVKKPDFCFQKASTVEAESSTLDASNGNTIWAKPKSSHTPFWFISRLTPNDGFKDESLILGWYRWCVNLVCVLDDLCSPAGLVLLWIRSTRSEIHSTRSVKAFTNANLVGNGWNGCNQPLEVASSMRVTWLRCRRHGSPAGLVPTMSPFNKVSEVTETEGHRSGWTWVRCDSSWEVVSTNAL